MRVLVTGSSGFIGTNLCKSLSREPSNRIYGVDLKIPQDEGSVHTFIPLDITDPNFIDKCISIVQGPIDRIYHLAAQTSGRVSEESPILDISINCIGTINVVNLAEQLRSRYGQYAKIIFSSSMAVYGNSAIPFEEGQQLSPVSNYGVSKIFGEELLRKYGRLGGKYTIFRLFNVFGPYQDMSNKKQGMLSIFLAQGINHGRFEVTGSLDRTRDFIYVDDVVKLLTSDSVISAESCIINVCSGVETSVKYLIKSICSALGLSENEKNISVLGSHAGDILNSVGCTNRLRKYHHEPFVSFDSGLLKFVRFLNGK